MANNVNDDFDDEDEEIFLGRIRGHPRPIITENDCIDKSIGEKTRIINKFGLKVFQSLFNSNANLVICPLNLFSSLLILYIGSNGDTFFELRQFLDFENFDDETICETVKDVLQIVSNERYRMANNYHLLHAIRVLIDERADISERFSILLKRYFNAEIHKIDFKRDGHLITEQINQSIQIDLDENQSKGFQTNINMRTQLIVLSAVTFKNIWLLELPLEETNAANFFNDGKTEVRVQMMGIKDNEWNLAFNVDWDSNIAELPMKDQNLSFLLILPKKITGMSRLLKEFTFDSLESTLKAFHLRTFELYLPLFKIDDVYDFAQNFSQLKVFTDESEMKAIAGKLRMKANHVLHKVMVQIDRNGFIKEHKPKGTQRPRVIRANHPFLFIIRDKRTQTHLFIGKITRIQSLIE